MQGGFQIDNLRQEATYRWLKPTEVFYILRNHERLEINQVVPNRPPSGSLLLFNKRVLRYFRRDGHEWRKRRDGRTVGEAHEHLKVGNLDAINCYYAHGEQNSFFQRRCYWLLDPAYEHIVLVHYREVSEGRYTSGPSTSSDFCSTVNNSSCFTDAPVEPLQNSHSSDSPSSIEVNSMLLKGTDLLGYENIDERQVKLADTSKTEFESALQKLEVQLSLDDDTNPINDRIRQLFQSPEQDFLSSSSLSPVINDVEVDSRPNGVERTSAGDIQPTASTSQMFGSELYHHMADYTENMRSLPCCSLPCHLRGVIIPSVHDTSLSSVSHGKQESFSRQQRGNEETKGDDKYYSSIVPGNTFELLLSDARKFISDFDEYMVSSASSQGIEDGYQGSAISTAVPENVNRLTCSDWNVASTLAVNSKSHPSDLSELLLNQDQGGTLLEDLTLTVSDKQLFSIHEISPEQAFTSLRTKVIIIGDFLCDSSEYIWKAMFGDTEVPLDIIRDGVLRCWTPTHLLGKVSLCVTSGNRIACSELREFEFIPKTKTNDDDVQSKMGKANATEDLELLTGLAKILFCNLDEGLSSKEGSFELQDDEGHRDIYKNPLPATCWILQEALKDKLRNWLSDKSHETSDPEKNSCPLSKQEQGIIHMIAGLGYEWALKPLLDCRIGINFRDANGWTALHWAAHFGREKMISALIAAGASPGAVTDPTSQDPVGRTPASLASRGGYKGLAGYLSEVALTNHLLSLTIGESDFSQAFAAVEAEKVLESLHIKNILPRDGATEDQLSLQDSLNAVKNATHAAARIHAAFRALSFKKRQKKATYYEEYGLTPEEIYGLSVAPRYHPYQKGSHGTNDQEHHGAALCIQKKYRGWKGRKSFLTLRNNVVKIQAHVRGYQVRKKYQLLWCVNVLEKVVLRWRRRGVGLRGFRSGSGLEDMDETEEEDILKVFRRKKVDAALNEAVNRVLSMVESPEARQQYRRLLDSYRRAKAEQINAVGMTDQSELFENIDEEMQSYLSLDEAWGVFE